MVATAAPITPSSGKGPQPNIKNGSRIMFNPFDNISVHIAIEASPAPLKIALIKNNKSMVILPPISNLVYPAPSAIKSGSAPISASISLWYKKPTIPTKREIIIPKKIACTDACFAPSMSFSPTLRATTAVAAILKPIAIAYTNVITDSVKPIVATAFTLT